MLEAINYKHLQKSKDLNKFAKEINERTLMSDWEEVKNTTEQNEVWDFKTNMKLIGKFTGTKENVGKNNSKLHLFEVEGKPFAAWGTAILDSRLQGVAPGSDVLIEYHGKQTQPNGRSIHAYKVYVKPGTKPATTGADTPTEDIPF